MRSLGEVVKERLVCGQSGRRRQRVVGAQGGEAVAQWGSLGDAVEFGANGAFYRVLLGDALQSRELGDKFGGGVVLNVDRHGVPPDILRKLWRDIRGCKGEWAGALRRGFAGTGWPPATGTGLGGTPNSRFPKALRPLAGSGAAPRP